MKVTIFGPNLRVQSKGTFHVHAADCGDCSKYGPGTRYGGDDRGWTVEAASQFEVSQDVYADHAGDDYESGSPEWVKYLEDAVSDFYFAPCVKLPFREAVTA